MYNKYSRLTEIHRQHRRIARMAKSFTLVDGELYKHAASGVLHRCIPIPRGREPLRGIHAGVCGHHTVPRTLVDNAFHQGFYWPTAIADPSEIVRTCANSTPARPIS
jgi:hypothetical protein